ncbi:pyridoxal phosphate-dependent transferase [Pisolithus croceorrhizus]|nr:pyridoxal phosphate-dependent transferase [Pisolithus croceorrhizus]
MPILGLAPSVQPQRPAHFDIEKVIRPNILSLHPYRSRIAQLRSLPDPKHDEVIDLLMRVCVTPGCEKILITPPTYGMYTVCAHVNDVGIVRCNLNLNGDHGEGGENGRFSLVVNDIKAAVSSDPTIKLIFLCSPGNPYRNIDIPRPFKGIIVVDEAYIDFAGEDASAVSLIKDFGNLCVMQTLSKSFGLAGIRLGLALAQPPLIQILTNTKGALQCLHTNSPVGSRCLGAAFSCNYARKDNISLDSRKELVQSLSGLGYLGLGPIIGGNDANFLVVPVVDKVTRIPDNGRSQRVYKVLAEENGVVVRYRGGEPGCAGCLRITVGTPEENKVLLQKLRSVLEVL